jgi:hypothetical protein
VKFNLFISVEMEYYALAIKTEAINYKTWKVETLKGEWKKHEREAKE